MGVMNEAIENGVGKGRVTGRECRMPVLDRQLADDHRGTQLAGFFDIVVGQSSQGQDGGDCPFRWSYKVRPSRVTTEAM